MISQLSIVSRVHISHHTFVFQIQTEDLLNREDQPYLPSLYAFLARVTNPMCKELQKRNRRDWNDGFDCNELAAKLNKSRLNEFKFEELQSKSAVVLHRFQSAKVPESVRSLGIYLTHNLYIYFDC